MTQKILRMRIYIYILKLLDRTHSDVRQIVHKKPLFIIRRRHIQSLQIYNPSLLIIFYLINKMWSMKIIIFWVCHTYGRWKS